RHLDVAVVGADRDVHTLRLADAASGEACDDRRRTVRTDDDVRCRREPRAILGTAGDSADRTVRPQQVGDTTSLANLDARSHEIDERRIEDVAADDEHGRAERRRATGRAEAERDRRALLVRDATHGVEHAELREHLEPEGRDRVATHLVAWEPAAIEQEHAKACPRRDQGGGEAARACADDNHVVIALFRHRAPEAAASIVTVPVASSSVVTHAARRVAPVRASCSTSALVVCGVLFGIWTTQARTGPRVSSRNVAACSLSGIIAHCPPSCRPSSASKVSAELAVPGRVVTNTRPDSTPGAWTVR